MHQKNWTRRAAVAATLGLLAAASATAQQRVIRIIVPFGPGAVQDTIARTFNNELGQALGASVIVENRAGAGGTIGTALVAKAPPDGNTLVLAAASHTLAGHLSPSCPTTRSRTSWACPTSAIRATPSPRRATWA